MPPENKDTWRSARLSPTFMLLAVLFCVCLIISNMMEIKTVRIGALTVTAGMAVFPISYVINDCLVEIYGFAKARMVIWLGFAMNLLTALLLQVGIWLPGTDEWAYQEAMEVIFGAVPRIFVASFLAFLVGSLVNAYVMSLMKERAGSNKGFSIRAIVSTLWGESIDSLIFFPIAFAGTLPWGEIGVLIMTQALLKTLYEIIILPLTVSVVRVLRRVEDTTPEGKETGLDYRWLRKKPTKQL